jgi:hypothetical protein
VLSDLHAETAKEVRSAWGEDGDMEITVRNAKGVIDVHEGSHEVQSSGALIVNLDGGGQVAYSPVGWLSLEAPE